MTAALTCQAQIMNTALVATGIAARMRCVTVAAETPIVRTMTMKYEVILRRVKTQQLIKSRKFATKFNRR